LAREDFSTLEDTHLAECVKEGDEEAFRLLFRKHGKWVFSKIYRMLQNHQDTEEVYQDTFMKVWEKIGKWDANAGSFQAWLNEVTRNTAIDAIRKRDRIRETLLTTEDEVEVPLMNYEDFRPTPDRQVEAIEAKDILDRALDEVTKPNHRMAWILRHLEGLSIADISKTLKCPEGTVKIWIFRCTRELRQILTRKGLTWAS